MKKLLTLISALAVVSGLATVDARQLSPGEALAAACSQKGMKRMAAKAFKAEPAYTARQDGEATIYVFNNNDGNGFLVVAADDIATPLLGYSDSGAFDPANVPPALKWWLKTYDRQIGNAIADGYKAPRHVSTNVTRRPVEPLVHTKWNQSAPFNNQCPELTYNNTTQRGVTGCVATAMAQVMKTHNYPEKGVGSNSYSFYFNGTNHTVSLNFADITYDWADMVDVYTSASTEAQNDAVATLMYSCGVATNMSYGVAATGGSGTTSYAAATGLINYFGYDKAIQNLNRRFYDYHDWVEIVYSELAAGRPVLYGGRSDEGGHEFVCDGYSSDDYFHFNWGWGGASDGYYLLTALDPEDQGIGGSGSGYDMSENIIIGVQPPVEGSQLVPQMVLSGNFKPAATSYTKASGTNVTFGDYTTFFYSMALGTTQVTLGLKVTYPNGTVSHIYATNSASLSPQSQGWYAMTVPSTSFPVGSYTVSPAFYSGGKWYDVLVDLDCNSTVEATVGTDKSITFTVPESEQLEVTACIPESEFYIGLPAEIEVDFSAPDDFYGEVLPALLSNGNIIATGTPKGLSFDAGDTENIDWVTTFTPTSRTATLEAGNYELVIVGSDGTRYSTPIPVTLHEQQAESAAEVTSVKILDAMGSGTSSDPYLIDPNSIKASITIDGTEGYWASTVAGMIFNATTFNSVATVGSDFVGVSQGESKTITIEGMATGLADGTTYIFVPWSTTQGQMSNDFTYITTPSTTIEPVLSADDADATVTVYNLNGIAVATASGNTASALDGLAAGHYIVVTNSHGSTTATHMVKAM